VNVAVRRPDITGPGRRIVIVGGGQAAGAAMRKLRELRFDGEVVLVSEEEHAPYERPPLSKEYLWGAEQDVRYIASGDRANEQMLLGRAVTSVDPERRTVHCAGGPPLQYDALLLATGGQPRRLAVPGSDLPNVHHLRTAANACALRQSIESCDKARKPLLVVGGSWIGLEIAAGAREAGVEVVLLEVGDRFCTRTLPVSTAQWLHMLHASHGVDIRLRTSVVALEGDTEVRHAQLSDGSRIGIGAVVVGIGIAPNVALAQHCGALVRSGVVVDSHCRTTVPHIYAAGDVSEQACSWHDAELRIETWDNANRQGEAAALHMASPSDEASTTPTSTYRAAPPWFWSDQYGVNIQVVGAPLHSDAVITSGDEGPGRLDVHLCNGVVVGAIGIDRARDMRRLRKILAEGQPVTPEMLSLQGDVGAIPAKGNQRDT